MRRQPDLTLHELQQRLDREHRLRLSVGWIWILLRRWGLRHQKNPSAQEQDTGRTRARTSGAAKRGGSRRAELDPACLVFLDESGVTTEMTRRYGWAPHPERYFRRNGARAGHWRTLTVLAALTLDGMLASMTAESPTDGDVFLAFLEQALGPKLQPGHVVVLDNLGAHKVEGVRGLIESRGAQLLYLPPYSPDFNPIEQAWSKLKTTPASREGPRARSAGTGHRAGHRRHHSPKRAGLLPDTAVIEYSNYENALVGGNRQ